MRTLKIGRKRFQFGISSGKSDNTTLTNRKLAQAFLACPPFNSAAELGSIYTRFPNATFSNLTGLLMKNNDLSSTKPITNRKSATTAIESAEIALAREVGRFIGRYAGDERKRSDRVAVLSIERSRNKK
jgi:hypothetical protein